VGDDSATRAIEILSVLIDYPDRSWIVYYRDATGHTRRRTVPWYKGPSERVEEIARRMVEE
jgi:hypothetical protein